MNSNEILDAVRKMEFKNTFNPYLERCMEHDVPEAPELRSYYLKEMLDRAATKELDAIWVGRDLGHRGGRRTGLALTDDVHFTTHLARWNLEPKRLTHGEPVAEKTAKAIWDILDRVNVPIFLWNIFPLHPFEADNPFSNRAHNARERKAGVEILVNIVNYIKPHRIIAIGNVAFDVLSSIFTKEQVHKVRHPSYGGQFKFINKMEMLYEGFPNFELKPCNQLQGEEE